MTPMSSFIVGDFADLLKILIFDAFGTWILIR